MTLYCSSGRRADAALTLWVLILLMAPLAAQARTLNGFDLSNALVPADDIHRGGPPRDGIPSIDHPKFQAPKDTRLWRADDLMLTYDVPGASYAYPVGILNWHEIVNHSLGDMTILITFCPLCGTGMAFDPVVDGRQLSFGVSGLLYNSDLLMYDRQTESLWSQIEGRAISGPLAGTKLTQIPIRHELWSQWQKRVEGKARVLSTDTGHTRNYRRSPYGDYDHSERLYFPVTHTSRKYHPKTWVLGWENNGEAKAWPFPELEKTEGRVKDTVGGQTVYVEYDPLVPTASLYDDEGNLLAATQAFWFAWYTFHPDTGIFEGN